MFRPFELTPRDDLCTGSSNTRALPYKQHRLHNQGDAHAEQVGFLETAFEKYQVTPVRIVDSVSFADEISGWALAF